jgi:hypothetical protein
VGEHETDQLGLAARPGLVERALEMRAHGREADPEVVRDVREPVRIEERMGDPRLGLGEAIERRVRTDRAQPHWA